MVDPANTTLGRMLLDQITPAVMVLRTPLVEESCRRNGLSFIEMLNPFCYFNNIDGTVHEALSAELWNWVAKERLKQAITDAGDKDISDLCSDPPEIRNAVTTSELEFVPSWFQIFNKELVDTVSFSDHEAFDHPVACLVAVSSKDIDPIDKFVDLFNTNQLPSLLNDGAMDPKILKYFLLVHDNDTGMLEKATSILTEMRRTFGVKDCRLLCINSSLDGLEEHQENPWADYVRKFLKFDIYYFLLASLIVKLAGIQKNHTSHKQQFVGFLNMDDIGELRTTVQDLSSKHIIPHMELKIRVLNQQVSVTRKGFRNQIKNLWWRKGKEDAPDEHNGPTYTFSSIESQIRVLGDYAFMLQDYELALSNYRLISTDYKLDKAWTRFAGVQEMMGLCYFMLDQSRKDAEYCMENAFRTYLKVPSGMRNATRCGLWWAEMLKARSQYKDAAGVYFRISGEEPLHSAVMLEQASYCYLLSTPIMLRKYGFHLVLSGDLYQKCGQIKHAIRTYKGALSVFKGSAWVHIRDHVHFHIGKWYAFLGIFGEAVKHMLQILACSHQPRATQELFLRGFFQVIQETGKTFEIFRLQLPLINFPLTKVVFEDHRTFASPAAANIEESLWQSLEEDMIPSLSVIRTNWLESQPKVIPKNYKESNVCVSGESIKVDVSFKNPLQIPLSISNVSLMCEYSAESNGTESDSSSTLIDYQNALEMRAVSTSGDESLDASFFTLSEVDILMQGGETISVQLRVTPKVEGTLKVVGVRWKLSGSVVGVCDFDSDVVRKKVKGKRKPKQSIKGILKFLVIKNLPRLHGVIHDLPKTVYEGDIRCLTLEIRNPSKISVKSLKLRVSHPRFINIADQEVIKQEFPTCLEKQADSQNSTYLDTPKDTNSIFVFPETEPICWEKPLVWPLWFRAAVAGNVSLYITIYYEMEDKSTLIIYRTLRMYYNLKVRFKKKYELIVAVFKAVSAACNSLEYLRVLPSLEVTFQLSPCPSRLHEFLVRMDIINRTTSESFQVNQLSCVGYQWELTILQSTDSGFPSDVLMAGQALSCFFKLKTRVTGEDNVSSLSTSGRADVKLCARDSKRLYDTSISPFNIFHHHEKVHQKRPDQDHENTVDFILITESQRDRDPEVSRSKEIFTYYTCHCRIARTTPISWLMNGPQIVRHDFSAAICEINLKITVHNSSEDNVSVRFTTHDSTPINAVSNSASISGNELGWYDISRSGDIKGASDVMGTRAGKTILPESVSPFIWSGSTSTRFNLDQLSSIEVPLQICVFSPGTYDLSNYSLHWNLLPAGGNGVTENESRVSSGTCQGHSYHITVLQKD
ncbi:trafficking protein particle complex subunit 8 [Dorcoceras hygrometricum]|uniref:Trafficking protein particle complex subunit 8 n=1 Tax=Dorcoceras hygrometricum TaxID=472368 RepID=A0A2Z7A779_9LAMI|nr:trafficking protein particle complex subunit 8 [Dorcoceras hygrometricum]